MKKGKSLILTIGIFTAIGIFTVTVLPYIIFPFDIPGPDDVPLKKEIATKLVLELDEYGKITELDDCQRYGKSINGIPIKMSKEETEDGYGKYYKEVLIENEIDESDFERFREKLEKTKLRHYLRTDRYSVFIVDGILGNVWGYLYSHTEEKINYDYFKVDVYTIRIVEDLGDNWYRFGGT